jgi:hypothetical protein
MLVYVGAYHTASHTATSIKPLDGFLTGTLHYCHARTAC